MNILLGYGWWIISIIQAHGETVGDTSEPCDNETPVHCEVYINILVDGERVLKTLETTTSFPETFLGTYRSPKMRKDAQIQFKMKDYDRFSKNDLLVLWHSSIDYLENNISKENHIATLRFGKNYLKILHYWRDEYRDE